jgi:hypothetical protein
MDLIRAGQRRRRLRPARLPSFAAQAQMSCMTVSLSSSVYNSFYSSFRIHDM